MNSSLPASAKPSVPSEGEATAGVKVLVCGARGFDDRKLLGRTLAQLHEAAPIALVISGGAPGADRLAESWANHRHIPLCVFPANWHHEGKSAGPKRNQRMLDFGRPDLVVAFPGGPGTADMKAKARAAGVKVIEIQ